MPPTHIVAGPIDGMYHVLYRVPGTNVYSSVGCAASESLAQAECDVLNGQPDTEDQEQI